MMWRRMMWLVGVAVVLVGLAVGTRAQEPANAPADLTTALQARIDAYEASGDMIVGFCVRNTVTGQIVASHRANTLFEPASNLKLLTAAGALATLGEDFEFVTNVYLINGDIVVVGDFDPTLGDPRLAEAYEESIYADLDAWAQAIKQRLGEQRPGSIILVARGDTDSWRNVDWKPNQYTFWYAAPVAALNFNDNCFDVTFDVNGNVVTPALSPVSEDIAVVNQLTFGNRHIWSLTGNSDLSKVVLRGTVSQTTDEPLSVAIDNPPLLLGRVLADRLAKAGVSMTGSVSVVSEVDIPDTLTPVAQTRTPISDALWRSNRHSLNLAAECLLLRSGDGTWGGSVDMLGDVLTDTFGIAEEHFVLRDGSGLSSGNRVTPAAMTDVLAQAVRAEGGATLLASLPASGVSGRLVDRMDQPPYKGRVLGKTGYIAGVQCLSGFILNSDRRPVLTYSVLINRVPAGQGAAAQDVHDDLCRLLVDSLIAKEAGD